MVKTRSINLKSGLTRPECEFYRQQCNFTDEERAVFDLRVRGCSLVEIQQKLSMSESMVNRRIWNIKQKVYKLM